MAPPSFADNLDNGRSWLTSWLHWRHLTLWRVLLLLLLFPRWHGYPNDFSFILELFQNSICILAPFLLFHFPLQQRVLAVTDDVAPLFREASQVRNDAVAGGNVCRSLIN